MILPSRKTLSWLAALATVALALAPVLPAFAHTSAPAAGAADHPVAAHAHHAPAGSGGEAARIGSDLEGAPCSQHGDCNASCCATCAQCFTAAMLSPPPSWPAVLPMRVPTIVRLALEAPPETLIRPPPILSLA